MPDPDARHHVELVATNDFRGVDHTWSTRVFGLKRVNADDIDGLSVFWVASRHPTKSPR